MRVGGRSDLGRINPEGWIEDIEQGDISVMGSGHRDLA
jgi:hypothetical protein